MINALAGTNKKPVRNELVVRFPMADGTVKTIIVRDRLAVEDTYLKHVRAKLTALKLGADVRVAVTDREIKDVLIRRNVQV
jgi:hypothetical protein